MLAAFSLYLFVWFFARHLVDIIRSGAENTLVVVDVEIIDVDVNDRTGMFKGNEEGGEKKKTESNR